jgi:hypothetical protein
MMQAKRCISCGWLTSEGAWTTLAFLMLCSTALMIVLEQYMVRWQQHSGQSVHHFHLHVRINTLTRPNNVPGEK